MPLSFLALALALVSAPAQDDFAPLDKVLAPDGPGCVAGVERAGDPPLYRAWGRADLERDAPIGVGTVFEAGSVSKQFTAAAVALLAARGVLSLDDDVRRFIPEMPRASRPVTLRRLLGHTSGLRNWGDLVELQGWPEGRAAHTQDEIVRLLARQKALNFKPGAEYSYSNSNYVLLAEVVARATHQPFARFTREALFEPLGMTGTRWRDDFAAVVPGRAQAYSKDDAGAWRLDMPFTDVIGQGGLLTTAPDLLRWNAVLGAPPPWAAGWVRLMGERGRLVDGVPTDYALGLEYEQVAGRPAISHAGATAGYRSYLARAPRDGVSLALLCNNGELRTDKLGPEILANLLPASPPAAPAARAAEGSPPPQALSAYAGSFADPRSGALIQVKSKDGGLSLDGGPVWRSLTSSVFTNLDGSRRLNFDLTLRRLTFTRPGNAPVSLRRLTPREEKVSIGRDLAGAFRSDELGVEQRITRDHGALGWVDPAGMRHALKALYRDTFEDPVNAWTLQFIRNASGRVVALDFSAPRTRRVRFAARRVQPTRASPPLRVSARTAAPGRLVFALVSQ